jgi:hypothetical protein
VWQSARTASDTTEDARKNKCFARDIAGSWGVIVMKAAAATVALQQIICLRDSPLKSIALCNQPRLPTQCVLCIVTNDEVISGQPQLSARRLPPKGVEIVQQLLSTAFFLLFTEDILTREDETVNGGVTASGGWINCTQSRGSRA